MKSTSMAETLDFNLYVGTATGLLKGVSINPKAPLSKTFHNLQSGLPSKAEEITCMSWDCENKDYLLVGQANRSVKVFDVREKRYGARFDVSAQEEGQENHGPLRGIARFDEALVTASASGFVKVWRHEAEQAIAFNTVDSEVCDSGKLKKNAFENQADRLKHLATLKAGREVCRMIVSPTENHIIATGGKENDLQVWNLNQHEEPVFRAKNVKPNFLELRVPVWVSDICFPDVNSSQLLSYVNRHGHVRLYDTRAGKGGAQRRPIMELEYPDQSLTAISATGHDKQVLVGTSSGQLAMFDFRQEKKGLTRKYKGSVGGIRSIACNRDNGYFAAVGLDKFVRIYNVNSKSSVNKMYLKSRLNQVLLSDNFDPVASEDSRVTKEDQNSMVEEDKEETNDPLWDQMDVVGEKKSKKREREENNLLLKPVINKAKSKKIKKI